tara:strand:+ start:668 stop:874 length:207 start_codon:yes stop_codon:yes gene_type:complete
MRKVLLDALIAHANGHIQKHKANVEIYLQNSTGIGEHSNILEAIEGEINEIARYEEQLHVLEKHFPLM